MELKRGKEKTEEIKTAVGVSDRKVKVTQKFITALSLVSIIGFVGIISRTLFEYDISAHVEAAWMIVVGLGLVLEASFNDLASIRRTGLTSENFTNLTTVVIGSIACIAGILSFPYFGLSNPSFNAVKGIVSVIAIIVIFIQTWVIESK